MVDAPLPPPEEGRAENLWFKKMYIKNLDKKRFSLPLGPKRAWRVMDGPTPDHTLLHLSLAGSSGRFESVIKGPTHTKLWNQVSCCTAHSDPSLVRHGPGPCVSPRCPTAGTSVVPQVPLVQCLGAWKKRYPARLAGSCGPSDSAMRFSSPGVLPGSTSQQ